jgi:CheY-like chemotaxis protein
MGRNVLIIEDHADERESLQALLEVWGHHVKVAEDGSRGIALALAKQPDIVLVDLGLPDIDGSDVISCIRAAFGVKDIAIVALTGWSGREAQARSAGCDAYFSKPVEAEALKEILAAGVRRPALRARPKQPDESPVDEAEPLTIGGQR